MLRLVFATCLATLLAGCHLIDQRSFDRSANVPPKPPAIPVISQSGPRPLVTIRFDTPDIDYRSAVRAAVGQARARRPDVLFEVVTAVPATGTPEAQVSAAQAATPLGRDVAETIIGAGADPGQVELASRAEPGVSAPEVRIYLH